MRPEPTLVLTVNEGDGGAEPVRRVPVAISTPIGGLAGQSVTLLREVDGQFVQLPISQVAQYISEIPAAPVEVVHAGHAADATQGTEP